jgi:hypothetical protein
MDFEDIRQEELRYAGELSRSMLEWEKDKKEELPKILERRGIQLTRENIPQIVMATSFNEMCSPENITYCRLYLERRKCHEHLENLSCGLCNCPNYDASHIEEQAQSILVGKCKIKSRQGHYHFSKAYPRVGVWSCEECPVHHS